MDYLDSVSERALIYDMNKACQTGTYTANFLKDLTGKSDKEWWDTMLRVTKKLRPSIIDGRINKLHIIFRMTGTLGNGDE